MTTAVAKATSALADLATASTSSVLVLPQPEAILPPPNGITLLDAKNEIFLAYLQTLALRHLEVVRSARETLLRSNKERIATSERHSLRDSFVTDLIRHRVYLDKGVRPLEDRLKYQIDKVVKAADDEHRRNELKNNAQLQKTRRHDDDDGDIASDAPDVEVDELSFRPNPAAFAKERQDSPEQEQRSKASTGAYRPPRINATVMPTTSPRERRAGQPARSATMDEYINNELSTMPVAEPSIGSTIVAGGRHSKTAKERDAEQERREYEETNLMRLPRESKKELGTKRREAHMHFGGEDLHGLGQGADRIGQLTRRKDRGQGVLEKSRKRKDTADGPRGDGREAGAAFGDRRKKVMRRLR